MHQQSANEVKIITQLIISELLRQFNNSEDSLSSINTVSDLFIQAVLIRDLFKENKFFTREIKIISEDDAVRVLDEIKIGNSQGIKEFTNYVGQSEAKKFEFEVPYEYITDYVYLNHLSIEYEVIEDRLNIFAQCIDSKVLDYEDHEIRILDKVFRKFRRHLLLAINQKKYIDEVTHKGAIEAERIASSARDIADIAKLIAFNAQTTAANANSISTDLQTAITEANNTIMQAQEGAKKALFLSNKADTTMRLAKSLAEKAEDASMHAQKLANEADAQAKSTIANYISILGIFASIIFTLFGGVNLIGATVKLLEANSRLPYLTFIVALLMICLLTLLNMMIKWINSMNNLKGALDKFKLGNASENEITESPTFIQKYIGFGFYTRAVLVLGVVLGASLIGMYNVKKENIFNYSTETTTRHPIDKKSPDEQNREKEISLNKETTVVSKFTLSNSSQELKDDKKED
jgi:hypothetical protein